jgi:hypothetical protein
MRQEIWRWNFVLGLGLVFLFGGCAAIRRQEAQSTEDMLVAAGFIMKPANTPEKLAHLKTMQPLKMTTRSIDGHVIYSYADPDNCQCVYVGGPDEYAQYKRYVLKQELAQEKLAAAEAQEDAAQMQEDAAMSWGLWGPFWW